MKRERDLKRDRDEASHARNVSETVGRNGKMMNKWTHSKQKKTER